MDACFTAFDKDCDGFLSIEEFELICRALFRNDRGKIYGLDEKQLVEIYQIFDFKGDGKLDREEFEVRTQSPLYITNQLYIHSGTKQQLQLDTLDGTTRFIQCEKHKLSLISNVKSHAAGQERENSHASPISVVQKKKRQINTTFFTFFQIRFFCLIISFYFMLFHHHHKKGFACSSRRCRKPRLYIYNRY